MSWSFTNDSKDRVAEPTCESVKTISDDEAPIATPTSALGQKTLVNATFHHLFAWCVSCTKIIFIQCAPNVPLPYMEELRGLSISSQPLSALIAVACRSCDQNIFQQRGKRFDNYPTTLSLSPEWVYNTYMYHNISKLTPRPVTVAKHDGSIIAVPMDKLSQGLQRETGKYQILGLNASAACSRSASEDAMLAPYVSSSFV